jgi:hypothetical protein
LPDYLRLFRRSYLGTAYLSLPRHFGVLRAELVEEEDFNGYLIKLDGHKRT